HHDQERGKAEIIDLKGMLAGRRFRSSGDGSIGSSGARSGDDRGDSRREGRAERDATGVPRRLLQPLSDHAGWYVGVAGAAGPDGAVFDRAIRTLSALGEGAGWNTGRDVRAAAAGMQQSAIMIDLWLRRGGDRLPLGLVDPRDDACWGKWGL